MSYRDNRQKQEYWQQQLVLVRRAHQEDLNERKAFAQSLSRRVATHAAAQDFDEEKGGEENSGEHSVGSVEIDQPLDDHPAEYLARFSKDELKHDINILEQERDR